MELKGFIKSLVLSYAHPRISKAIPLIFLSIKRYLLGLVILTSVFLFTLTSAVYGFDSSSELTRTTAQYCRCGVRPYTVVDHEGTFGISGAQSDFARDLPASSRTIRRANKRRFVDLSSVISRTGTLLESVDPDDTQFGFVNWSTVLSLISKVLLRI